MTDNKIPALWPDMDVVLYPPMPASAHVALRTEQPKSRGGRP